MNIKLKSLSGIGSIPTDRTSITAWCKKKGIKTYQVRSNGGFAFVLSISDLPEPERIAYLRRELEASDLHPGHYDEDAHRVYMFASPKARSEAERRSATVRIFKRLGPDVKWADKIAIIGAEVGGKAPSKATINRYLKAVEDIDPINFAPALLPSHGGGRQRSETSEDAWSMFMTIIRDAHRDFPLKQAWRDVRDLAPKNGWRWPSYLTVYRRWCELPELQRQVALEGVQATKKRIQQPAHRDKTSLKPLEQVSMDGRTLDFWVEMEDGSSARPTMLVLTDIASNKVLGWCIARSENAVDTVHMIRDTCEKFGIFRRLNTDNGSAFAGHLVAGGAVKKFRNGSKATDSVQPLGVCHHLGIDLRFHKPGNPKAKAAERTFATLSRSIDDRPEFKNAHAGHAPGASPNTRTVPVSLAVAKSVYQREIVRYNAEPGRRSQGARGRSYDQMFADGLESHIATQPTERQLYLAGLIYSPVAVDRSGQIKVDGAIFGGQDTLPQLLSYHGGGQRVLLGRDPNNLSAPAIAYDRDGHLICEGIACIRRGAYDSKEGIRLAERNRRVASKALKKAEEENAYLGDREFADALERLDRTDTQEVAVKTSSNVVKPHFTSPLHASSKPKKSSVTDEMLKNLELDNAKRLNRG